MKRIKKVQVTITKNGRTHIAASFNSICKAQAYMAEFTSRVHSLLYTRQNRKDMTPSAHYAEILMYKKNIQFGGYDFKVCPDFWHSTEQNKIAEMRIEVIR